MNDLIMAMMVGGHGDFVIMHMTIFQYLVRILSYLSSYHCMANILEINSTIPGVFYNAKLISLTSSSLLEESRRHSGRRGLIHLRLEELNRCIHYNRNCLWNYPPVEVSPVPFMCTHGVL